MCPVKTNQVEQFYILVESRHRIVTESFKATNATRAKEIATVLKGPNWRLYYFLFLQLDSGSESVESDGV